MLAMPDVTAADLAFPSRAHQWFPESIIPEGAWAVSGTLPRTLDRKHIPSDPDSKAALRYHHNAHVFRKGFYGEGWADFQGIPRAGVDPEKAWQVLRCICGNFDFSAEHKEAAWAFAADEWFAAVWMKDQSPPPWASEIP
jgi:hypothetical protein